MKKNPSGRSKGACDVIADLREELAQPISVRLRSSGSEG